MKRELKYLALEVFVTVLALVAVSAITESQIALLLTAVTVPSIIICRKSVCR